MTWLDGQWPWLDSFFLEPILNWFTCISRKKMWQPGFWGYIVFFTDWIIEHDWHTRRSVLAKQRSVVRYAWNSLEKIWWPELPTKSTTLILPGFPAFSPIVQSHFNHWWTNLVYVEREAFRVSCQQHDKLVILQLFAKKWLETESTKER